MKTRLILKSYLLCAQLVLTSTGLVASEDIFNSSFEDPYSSQQSSVFERNEKTLDLSKKMSQIEDSTILQEADVEKEISISLNDGALELSQTFLDLSGINYTYHLKGSSEIEGLQIFVRDNSVIKFDKKDQIFSAIKSGSTEVVFVGDGKMLIIPVKVGNEFKAPSFAVNESFVEVDASYQVPRKLVTIEDAEDHLAATFSYENSKMSFAFEDLEAKNDSSELTIQVIDERSSVEDNKIYPVVGLDVRIIGSDRTLRTDSRGIAQFTGMPANSRVIVETFDGQGLFIPTKTEAVVEDGGVVRLKVLSSRKLMFMSEVTGQSFDTSYGSVCFNLMDADGSYRLSEMSIAVKTQQSDPVYWGQYGPDLGAISTGSLGRACFINLENGIHEFSVSDTNGVYSNFTYPVFRGYHNEEDIHLENSDDILVKLASLATANEQLYSDEEDAAEIRPVDDASIVELSINENLEKLSPGRFKLLTSTKVKGRRYLLNKSAEFADSIHTIDDGRSDVLTLVHRGFFEDLFHELYLDSGGPSIAYDQAQAQMMLQYRNDEISDVKLKVLDANGREVETGWYLPSSKGIHKAIFFNLDPGIYQLVISSKDGVWLDTTTVALDFWTNAVVNLGSPIKAKSSSLD